ncbi:hypothetical protein SELMODRAFT_100719, partial [Selaginella moellendorffii]
IGSYAKLGSVADARKVFDKLPQPDLVSWTALLAGYADRGDAQEVSKALFDVMPQQNSFSWTRIFNAARGIWTNGCLEQCQTRFKSMPERTPVSWNTMIAVYCQFSCLDEARLAFDRMLQRHVVSWSSVITGLSHCGRVSEARGLLASMPTREVTAWNIMTSAY